MKMPAMAPPDLEDEAAEAQPAPKQPKASRPKTSGAGASGTIADVKKRAKRMLTKGLISQKQHDNLVGKADKVSQALGAQLMPQE